MTGFNESRFLTPEPSGFDESRFLTPEPEFDDSQFMEPDPTIGDYIGAGVGSLLKGAMGSVKMLPDVVNMISGLASDDYANTGFGQAVKAASNFFERGQNAANDVFQSEEIKRSIAENEIYDADTGEWHAPNTAQISDAVLTVLPMLPSFIVGGGTAGAGLKLAGMGEKASRFAGYGGFNMLAAGADTFEEATDEARAIIDESSPELNDEERNVLANAVASEATVRTMPVNFITGMMGLGGAANVSGALATRVLKGAAVDAPFEALEEGVQGLSVNEALQTVDPDRPLDQGVRERAVMGAIAGGVLGGGVAGVEGTAQKLQKVAGEMQQVNSAEEAVKVAGDNLNPEGGTDAPVELGDILLEIEVEVDGELTTMEQPADQAIQEADTRLDSIVDLRKCLRG